MPSSELINVILAYRSGCWVLVNYATIVNKLWQFMSLAFIYWKNRRRSAISVLCLLRLMKTKILVVGMVRGNYSGRGLYIFDSQISPMEGSHLRRKKTQVGECRRKMG